MNLFVRLLGDAMQEVSFLNLFIQAPLRLVSIQHGLDFLEEDIGNLLLILIDCLISSKDVPVYSSFQIVRRVFCAFVDRSEQKSRDLLRKICFLVHKNPSMSAIFIEFGLNAEKTATLRDIIELIESPVGYAPCTYSQLKVLLQCIRQETSSSNFYHQICRWFLTYFHSILQKSIPISSIISEILGELQVYDAFCENLDITHKSNFGLSEVVRILDRCLLDDDLTIVEKSSNALISLFSGNDGSKLMKEIDPLLSEKLIFFFPTSEKIFSGKDRDMGIFPSIREVL
jgi:hypothetical protein